MTQLIKRKVVVFHSNALGEFYKFPLNVVEEFLSLKEKIEELGQLKEPDSKKLTKELLEFRVKMENQYRCIYAYYKKSSIVILVCFTKKTQKVKNKYIDLAYKRLKQL